MILSKEENPFIDKDLDKDLDAYRELMTQDPSTSTSKITEFDQRRIRIRKESNEMWERTQDIHNRMQESEDPVWEAWVRSGFKILLPFIVGLFIVMLICLGFLMLDMTFGGL